MSNLFKTIEFIKDFCKGCPIKSNCGDEPCDNLKKSTEEFMEKLRAEEKTDGI